MTFRKIFFESGIVENLDDWQWMDDGKVCSSIFLVVIFVMNARSGPQRLLPILHPRPPSKKKKKKPPSTF